MRAQADPSPLRPSHIAAVAIILAAAGAAFGQAEVNVAAKGRVTTSSSAAANPPSLLIDGNAATRWISNGATAPNGDCGGTTGETVTWWTDTDIPIEHLEIAGAQPAAGGFTNYQVLCYNTKNELVFARPTGATPCSSSVTIGTTDSNISFTTTVPAPGGGANVPVNASRVVINFTNRSGAGGMGELRVFTKRPGSMPPLGPKPDDPVLRDDEVIVTDGVAATGATRVGVFQPMTPSPAPTVQLRGAAQPDANAYANWPIVAADRGRIYGAPAEQMVVLRSNGTQFVLQVLDTYASNVTPPLRPIIRGEYLFTPSNPSSDVAMVVTDIDKKLINGVQQQEIVLAYEGTEVAPPNRRVAQVQVLRFNTPTDLNVIPPAPAAPVVLYNGQPRYTFPNSGPTFGILRNNGTGPNHIVLKPFKIGNSLDDANQVLMAHMASDRTRPVYAIFSLDQLAGTFTPRNTTVDNVQPLVDASQVNTFSWDVWTGRITTDPTGQAGDNAVFVSRAGATSTTVHMLPMNWTNSSQAGGVPDLEYNDSGTLSGADKNALNVRNTNSSVFSATAIAGSRLDTLRYHMVAMDARPDRDGIAVLMHTTRGPVVNLFGYVDQPGSEGALAIDQVANTPWPSGSEATGRPTYAAATNTFFTAGMVPLRRSNLDQVANRRYNIFVHSAETTGNLSPTRIVRIGMPSVGNTVTSNSVIDFFNVTVADGGATPTRVGPIVCADIDGDSAYYSRLAGGVTYFLSAPTRLSFDNFAAPLAIIQEPPKHIDYFRPYHASGSPQNNQRGVFSITGDPAFVSEFENSQGADVSSTVSQSVSTTIGSSSSSKIGAEFTLETPVVSGSAGASFTQLTSQETTAATSTLNLSTTSFSFSNRVSTAFDDGLILQERDLDIWRFPIAGPTGNSTVDNAAASTFIEMSIPGPLPPVTLRAGKDLPRYQPQHINGNLLSYPQVGRLSTIVGSDKLPFRVGAANNPSSFNTVVQAVTDILNPPSFTPSGIGGVSTVTFTNLTGSQTDYQTSTTNSSSNTLDITASAKIGGGSLFGLIDTGLEISTEFTQTFSNSNTFSSGVTSLNTSSVTNQWQIIMPPFTDLSPLQQVYSIRSFVFFDKAGAAKLQYAVDLPTGTNFWSANYTAPDAALNLPYRIINFQGSWQLSTFPDRFKMRSYEVRDLATASAQLNQNQGQKVVDVAPAARDLAIYARVYNLSYATPINNLASRFDMVEIDTSVNPPVPIGSPVSLGAGQLLEDTAVEPDGSVQPPPAYRPAITTIPARGTALVRLPLLNTDNLGPATNAATGAVRTYRIMVTLDPNNAIPNETHELFDRDNDPLAPGDTIFASAFGGSQLLEKGQNNFGWFDLQIGKSLCKLPDISASPADRQVSPGQNTTFTAQVTQRIGEVLTYRWKHNGVDILNGGRFTGATSLSLTINGVQTADAGDYTLAVTNSCATVLSTPAHLTTGCGPADVAGLGGSSGADGALTADDVIAYLTAFFGNNLAIADIAGLGGTPGPNGTLTVDDIIFFLGNFFQPCP